MTHIETPATEQEPKPIGWMMPEHVEAYRNGWNDGIAWINPERNDAYTFPVYAQPVAVADVRGKVIEEAVSIAHEWADKMAKNNGRETANTIADRIRALQQQAGRPNG